MQGLVSWLVLVAAFAVVAAVGCIMTARLCRFGVRSLRLAGDAAPSEPPQVSLSERLP